MRKSFFIQSAWLLLVVIPILTRANVTSETKQLQDDPCHSSLLTISIDASGRKKTQLPARISKKKLSNIKPKLFNEIDFHVTNHDKLKRANDPFDEMFNEENKTSKSSLYELNFMDDKSDINRIVFHLLPFFNEASKDNNNNQSKKPGMFTLFKINFF